MRYVNDSKATNPDAALAALDAYPEGVHLIAGGRAKGTPFDPLAAAARPGVVRAYLVGEAGPELEDALTAAGVPSERAGTIEAAVAAAAARARPGRRSSCSRRPAPASTSSRATRSAARPSGRPCGGSSGPSAAATGAAPPAANSPRVTPPASRRRAPIRPPRAAMRPERILAAVVLALVCFGLVMVFSASSATALLDDSSPLSLVTRQAIYAAIGLVLYLALSRARPGWMREVAGPAVAVTLVLLLAVLAVGAQINGAKRWIDIGPIQIQPSELAKLSVVLWIAAVAARRAGRLVDGRELRPFVALTGVVVLLILVEPDLGTAVVLFVTVLVMLLVAGARPRHVALVATAACALGAAAIAFEPYRRARLLAFLDPMHDSSGGGFQIVQAKLALGSGGLHGVGIGNGLQKVFYLPEAHTDMIAATVGEELGLLGVVGLIAAFVLVAAAGYRIALRGAGAPPAGPRRRPHDADRGAGDGQSRRRAWAPARDRRAPPVRLLRWEQPSRLPRLRWTPRQHRAGIRPRPIRAPGRLRRGRGW